MACLERLQVCRVVSPLAAPTARTPRSLLVSDFFKHHTQQLAAAAQVGDAKAIRRTKITEGMRMMKSVRRADGSA